FNLALHEREQRVVAAHTDVVAGVHASATLAHDDRAGRNQLAVVALHAEALGVAIAAVLGAGTSFLVCHFLFLRLLFRGPGCRRLRDGLFLSDRLLGSGRYRRFFHAAGEASRALRRGRRSLRLRRLHGHAIRRDLLDRKGGEALAVSALA